MGKNCKKHKRYLIMTMKEAHALYSDEFMTKPVKLAKFVLYDHKLCALSKKHYTMYAFGIIMRM
jgi:hypothetical protein